MDSAVTRWDSGKIKWIPLMPQAMHVHKQDKDTCIHVFVADDHVEATHVAKHVHV